MGAYVIVADGSAVQSLEIDGVMGNLGKPLNFPFVWARKGQRNLGVRCGIVPRGLLAERGTLNYCLRAQHVEW